MKTAVNTMLNRAGNLLLLLVGIESLCMLVCDSFGMLFPRNMGIWLAVICAFMWFASSFRRGAFIGLPLSALAVFLLFRQSETHIREAFLALAERLTDRFYAHFNNGTAEATAAATEGSAMALFLVLTVLAGFLAFSLASGSFRISLSRLAVLPFFLICILVNSTPPVLPTLGILLFWIGLQLSGDAYLEKDAAGKSLLLGIMPCALVLAGLLLLYRPSTYQYDERDISLSQQFDQISSTLSSRFGGSGAAQGGDSQAMGPGQREPQDSQAPAGWSRNAEVLDLTAPFDSSALPQTAMTLHTDASGSVYLRGRAFGDYTGTTWTAAVENTHSSALNYTGHVLSSAPEQDYCRFQVSTPTVYDILYLPYFTITGGTGDVLVPSGELTSYSGDFVRSVTDVATLQDEAQLPSAIVPEEEQYREFVASYYTRLPDATRSALSAFCREEGLDAEREDLLSAVASLVRNRGVYDLSVEVYPSSDYAVYFLTESARGYCIHYATAAVALYRTLGIPARVCEGYLVSSVPNTDVRVTGENAHAWAEVYLDGLGWIPVEVTASMSETGLFPEDGGAVAPSAEGEVPLPADQEAMTEEAAAEKSETAETEAPEPSASPESKEEVQPDEAADSEGTTAGAKERLNTLMRVLSAVIGIPAFLAVLLYGRYRWLRYRFERKLSLTSGNGKAILMYRHALLLTNFGAQLPAGIRTAAEKAAFSQHELSNDEVRAMHAELETITRDTYNGLTKWNKFVFRYLFALQ